jgi:hypothetical protein
MLVKHNRHKQARMDLGEQESMRHGWKKARWSEVDLASRPKGHHVKVKIAQQLRRQTPMSRQCIADRLRIGSASYVSNLLSGVDSKRPSVR